MTRRDFIISGASAITASSVARPIRSSLGGRMEYEGVEALPYDSAVEYLESTGTQYIDTEVIASSKLSVQVMMANTGTPWTNVNPMGAILVSPRMRHHLNFQNGGSYNGINYYFGFGDFESIIPTGFKPRKNEVFIYKVDAINRVLTVGSIVRAIPNVTFDLGEPYWLFGRIGTVPPYLGKLRIYATQMWVESVLVRDLIPVRLTNEYGVLEGAMFDMVTGGLFRNKGTGSFIIGPDIS